jgi:ABC-2 type transport system ATP-binding protein
MKQRLSLARTLIHDPQVLILDEPASGLDPRARVEIRELLVELARMGKTIFFSTHILSDVAEICSRVGIIEAGKLVASGTLEELQQHLLPHRQVRISVLARAEEAAALLQATPGVQNVQILPGGKREGDHTRLELEYQGEDTALSSLLGDLMKQGIPVVNFNVDSRDLEEVFLRATKGMVT